MTAAALVLPLLGVAAGASPTHADPAVRWASPTGSGSDCTQDVPCALDIALAPSSVQTGDEVVVEPGTYSVVGLAIDKAISVHGQAGEPVPTINTSGLLGVNIAAAVTLSDLNLVASGVVGLHLNGAGSVVQRVTSRVTDSSGDACSITASVLVRDTVCWATGANSSGVVTSLGTNDRTIDVTLRNVTAVGSGPGLSFAVAGTEVVLDVDAKNVIAESTHPGRADVRAAASQGAAVHITLTNSSYETEEETVQDGGLAATVTDPGSGTNQTAPPLFVDAFHGDFHQADGSPTLDAGVLDASTGATDFEGDARALRATSACPALPDIGADERATNLSCDPPATTTGGPSGPETTLTRTPAKRVATTKRRATVRFAFSSSAAGTFECSLDGRPFAGCASPARARLGPGRHTFAVRAVSVSGVADPTPASVAFRVRVKRSP